jgi:hypothetical protein
MNEQDRDWLEALSKSLWKRIYFNPVPRVGPDSMLEEARHLTGDEWVKLQDIIQRNDLICELQTTGWGFYVGMALYWENPPVYPGVPVQLDLLIFISAKHLPEDLIPSGPRLHFRAGWDAFSPFTHSDENAQRLVSVGRPKPREQAYYDY